MQVRCICTLVKEESPHGYRAGMPNQPMTPNRAFRVADDVWFPALWRAQERDEPLSEAIRRFLVEYARPKPGTRERPIPAPRGSAQGGGGQDSAG